ncbi:alpha-amylase family glycosyl hydrolase [uncultured Arthrobacter sp.]|uniref:alpha-amylase family glycosyl hydrolase n=1 Tax=uncultured Arthrobacter sp. TaxID=114050 RepID=UPI00345B9234
MIARNATAVVLASLLAATGTALPAQAKPAGPNEASTAEAQQSLRAPVTDENFYFVMADRFANGTTANDDGGLGPNPMVSGFDPTRKGFYNGGDLKGLLDRLDYIEGLGTTSIWLTPSFKNKAVQSADNSAGYHGYWITDFTQIDPHLGSNEDLKALIDEAHSRGMKVYFDIITNHTADVIGYEDGDRLPYVSKDEVPYRTADGVPFDDRDVAGSEDFPELAAKTSFPYAPVLGPGEENLKVPAWLNDPTLYHNRGDTTFAGEDSYYGDFFGLDDLFTEHPVVVDGMKEIYQTWIADFGVDGFRIDTMKHVDDGFWQEFGPDVLEFARDQGKDEFFMFGEVFDTTKDFTSQYTTRNSMQAVLDFPFQEAARSFASRGADAQQLEQFFIGDDWYTDADSNAYSLPTFLGNHDMGRIGGFVAADNPDAGEDELLARDELAHELMYFSRGNPVIYYGDEQGFTGPGGDQDARQTLFASQVADYLDDDLLGTEATHAQDNFNTEHPLYQSIGTLAEVTEEHPALRNGAHQHRYASEGAGIYAFSRIDTERQREYVVALNNSEEAQTAEIPTYMPSRTFKSVYGEGEDRVKSARDGSLTVTVPPLSAVVYEAAGRIPASKSAPAISLAQPAPAEADNGRMLVEADVDGSSFYQVSFEARTAGGDWTPIGTDDNAPYRVFHDVAALDPGTPLEYRAVVLDNKGHTAGSGVVGAEAPAPIVALQAPEENTWVRDAVELSAVADPEKATHVVSFERSVNGGEWEEIGADSSSPAYTLTDDISALGLPDDTQLQYRAVLGESVSNVRTVTIGDPVVVQPANVSVPGSLNSEMGCPGDWDPACDQAQMTLGDDGLWRLAVDLPAGDYEYKAAIDKDWPENYGAGGAPNGPNIPLAHDGGPVTFTYDHRTHLITAE